MRLTLKFYLITLFTSFLFFALFAPMGHLPSDSAYSYATARSLLHNRTLAVAPSPDLPDLKMGKDGKWYSKYGIGFAVLLLPVVAAADVISACAEVKTLYVEQALLSYVNTAVAALIAVLFFSIFISLGYSRKLSLVAVVMICCASILLPYSKILHAELPTALVLVWFIRVSSGRRVMNVRNGITIGLIISLLMLIKPGNICYAAVVFIYGLWLSCRQGRELSGIITFLLVPCSIGLFLAYMNWARFGNPLDFGYGSEQQKFTTPLTGLAGFVFSPSRSLLLFSPLSILCCMAAVRMYRKERVFTVLVGAASGCGLIFNACWYAWDGGWAWGPRLIVPAIILFHLLLPEYLAMCSRSMVKRVVLVIFVTAGTMINVTGALVWYQQVYYFHYDNWSARHAHPIIAGKLLLHKMQGKPEVYKLENYHIATPSAEYAASLKIDVTDGCVDFSAFEKFRGCATMWDGVRHNFGYRFAWILPLMLVMGTALGFWWLWRYEGKRVAL